MENKTKFFRGRVTWLMVWTLLFVFSGSIGSAQVRAQDSVLRTDPSQLQPGLATVYIENKYRNVDQVPTGKSALRQGYQGKPVMILDHQSGKEEFVFDSGRSQGVAMVMDGFLYLEKIGVYRFQALANDGIRLFINNRMIFEDPRVHGDRLSPAGAMQVNETGWYPVHIIYFQRKGTAALKLYWQTPAADEFSLVPAEVYWH